jgi:hypothetical protein
VKRVPLYWKTIKSPEPFKGTKAGIGIRGITDFKTRYAYSNRTSNKDVLAIAEDLGKTTAHDSPTIAVNTTRYNHGDRILFRFRKSVLEFSTSHDIAFLLSPRDNSLQQKNSVIYYSSLLEKTFHHDSPKPEYACNGGSLFSALHLSNI